MSKAVPWGVKGLGFDVREAAQEAARREGMTLGEWLSETISERAAQAGIAGGELADDERLEAIAGRLHELDSLNDQARERRRHRARDEAQESPPMRRAEATRRHIGQSPASISAIDAEDLLARAVELFQRQGAQAQRRTTEALASVARVMEASEMRRQDERAALEGFSRRLGEIESNLSQRSADDNADALKAALSRLETRLDVMARRPDPDARKAQGRLAAPAEPHDGASMNRLEAKLNSILAAVAPAKPERTAAEGGNMRAAASTRSLGETIAQISRRQRDLEAPTSSDMPLEPAIAISQSANRPATRADILALAERIEAVRRDMIELPAKSAPVFDLDKLHAEIGQMSTALHDLATRGSVAALEGSIRRLADQIDVSRREGANETVLWPLEKILTDLRRGLLDIDPRTSIAGLERQIKALDSKLEILGQPHSDADAFAQVQQQTQEIHDLLTAAAARPAPAERLERQVAQLAHKLDRQQQIAALSSDDRAPAPQELAHLIKNAGLGDIGERLDAIAARVENAVRGSGLDQKGPDTRALEELVRDLAEKLEAARAPQSDSRAIEALEHQIGELASRLERSSTGLASLAYLQQAVGDLFAKFEAAQQITIEAAQAAARNAVEVSLREASAQGAFDLRPLLGGQSVHDGVTRELVELRDFQDAADRRTHSTLNAVHETLEKVVDRLAMLEEELGDIRADAPATTLASGPAPNFSAAPRRDPPIASPAQAVRDASVRDRPRRDEPPAKPARGEELEDFLIEPGRGFPGRGDLEPESAGDRKRKADRRTGVADSAVTGRADFIAAARRAAQAAQMESAAAAVDARPAASDDKSEPRQNLIAQARRFIAQRKRPVVLSVAAVFLLVGAYAVFNSVTSPSAEVSHETPKPASQEHAQTNPPAPPVDTAPDTASLAADVPSPTAPIDPQRTQAIPGSDPIVVGTITPKMPPAAASESTHDMPQAALQSLADVGNPKAQFEIASRYVEGRGFARDLKAAATWYEKSAQQGLAAAQYRIGSLYEKGGGVNRDLAQAKAWYLKAAEQGHVRAMHNLAVLTAEVGETGKPDYAGAAQWFYKAAEYGVRDSQYNYAILLARGLGVAQNLSASYTWFAIAAAQGDEDAGKKREDVGARLSAADLAAAKTAAQAFRAKTADAAVNETQWPAPVAPQPVAKPQKPKVSQL
jgi:localization factor PodJL